MGEMGENGEMGDKGGKVVVGCRDVRVDCGGGGGGVGHTNLVATDCMPFIFVRAVVWWSVWIVVWCENRKQKTEN